jgi:hypothetical protein
VHFLPDRTCAPGYRWSTFTSHSCAPGKAPHLKEQSGEDLLESFILVRFLPHLDFSQPDPDFIIFIAIMIPFKNQSGKIADRFSRSDRIPVFPEKSIRDFFKKNRIAIEKPARGSRLRRGQGKKVQTNLFNFS